MTDSESDFRITRDTPYLALTGELWGVFCEDLEENGPGYNGTALYQNIDIFSNKVLESLSTTYFISDLHSQLRINTLKPRQMLVILQTTVANSCVHISIQIKISLKSVPNSPINNTQPLVQIMAWHRPGNNPSSEPITKSRNYVYR